MIKAKLRMKLLYKRQIFSNEVENDEIEEIKEIVKISLKDLFLEFDFIKDY